MQAIRTEFPSDLTEAQWEYIKYLIPLPRSGGRPRTTNIRQVMDAIFYLVRTGVPWRYLPKTFPKWKTVYDYYSKWAQEGVWEKMNEVLLIEVRLKLHRKEYPSLAIVDAQSVRAQYGEQRGLDAAKKVRGRKRNILVDTLGLIWALHVGAGNVIDAKGGLEALYRLPRSVIKSIRKILADTVYTWPFDYYAEKDLGIEVEIIKGKIKEGRSNLKPKRWLVERTFAWFNRFRRLSRDYEKKTLHSEAMIYIAMEMIMLKKLLI